MSVDSLSEQLSQLSAWDFSSVGVTGTCVFATRSFCNELRGERCVELTASHALLVFREGHTEWTAVSRVSTRCMGNVLFIRLKVEATGPRPHLSNAV